MSKETKAAAKAEKKQAKIDALVCPKCAHSVGDHRTNYSSMFAVFYGEEYGRAGCRGKTESKDERGFVRLGTCGCDLTPAEAAINAIRGVKSAPLDGGARAAGDHRGFGQRWVGARGYPRDAGLAEVRRGVVWCPGRGAHGRRGAASRCPRLRRGAGALPSVLRRLAYLDRRGWATELLRWSPSVKGRVAWVNAEIVATEDRRIRREAEVRPAPRLPGECDPARLPHYAIGPELVAVPREN